MKQRLAFAAAPLAFWCLAATACLSGGAVESFDQPLCHETGGLTVCADLTDVSMFFDTPNSEVAYNIELIRIDGGYATVYHAEVQGSLRAGDSIKAGSSPGGYRFTLPSHSMQFGGLETRPTDLLDADGIGGGANPMTVAGRHGDPNLYIFFLGVSDDAKRRDFRGADWRHYLLLARTRDFKSIELLSTSGWQPTDKHPEPTALSDSSGTIIRSDVAQGVWNTQGLIGSISYVSGTYYYFYDDFSNDGAGSALYLRTTSDLVNSKWSPPVKVLTLNGFPMIRVGKLPGRDRWAVLYNCDRNGRSDVCIQITQNLSIFGEGGISHLDLSPAFALGLSNLQPSQVVGQPNWLTDRWGNVAFVRGRTGRNGGEVYWSNFAPSTCASNPRPLCPVAGAKVYRIGWYVR